MYIAAQSGGPGTRSTDIPGQEKIEVPAQARREQIYTRLLISSFGPLDRLDGGRRASAFSSLLIQMLISSETPS